MKKRRIVINGSYGGYNLSHEAIMLYAKKKGIEIYMFKRDETDRQKFILTNDEPKSWMDERNYFTKPIHDYKYFFIPARDDPILVEVVEELGRNAHENGCELKIVEIPWYVRWDIHNYDGLESVVSKRHQWWG